MHLLFCVGVRNHERTHYCAKCLKILNFYILSGELGLVHIRDYLFKSKWEGALNNTDTIQFFTHNRRTGKFVLGLTILFPITKTCLLVSKKGKRKKMRTSRNAYVVLKE